MEDLRPKRPVKASTTENIEKASKLNVGSCQNTRRISLQEWLGRSLTATLTILHGSPGMSEICPRWEPKMISPHQKQRWVFESVQWKQRPYFGPDFSWRWNFGSSFLTWGYTRLMHFNALKRAHHTQPKFKVSQLAQVLWSTFFESPHTPYFGNHLLPLQCEIFCKNLIKSVMLIYI